MSFDLENNKYDIIHSSFENQAKVVYSRDTKNKRDKAVASGRAIDNSLKKGHFNAEQHNKYFSWDALGIERMKLWLDKDTLSLEQVKEK